MKEHSTLIFTVIDANGALEQTPIYSLKQALDFCQKHFGEVEKQTTSPIIGGKEPSKRVQQIILVLETTKKLLQQYHMEKNCDKVGFDRILSVAIGQVAEKLGISIQSVYDKLGRQLNWNKSSFAQNAFVFLLASDPKPITEYELYQRIVTCNPHPWDVFYIREHLVNLK